MVPIGISLFMRLSRNTLARYSALPKGSRTVLCSLNFAVDAEHHSSRIFQSMSNESTDDRYTVVSSAKSEVIRSSFLPGIVTPLRSEFRSKHARGSIARLNNRH
jgi:hypothetical protein